jgi:hypothetical protein
MLTLPAVALPAAAETPSQRDPRSASGPVTAGKTAAPAPTAADPATLEREEVRKVFDTWLRAWNAKDMEAYFGVYAKAFRPSDGESRDAWERQRRIRISNKSYINVRAESSELTIKQDTATIRFVQIYLSDRLRDETGKTLLFAKTNGKWQIVQERSQR